eukprot:TRINITY_DN7006_c0_g1_i2.p1 TRINITY_DN7006_c0_g1~~TRINITY_DN7006_c0_g1_i2.p1  ORF type:complete len:198 (+),score=94.51 TRINITY_DN7006_c0_g1_i2:425-1018(+)
MKVAEERIRALENELATTESAKSQCRGGADGLNSLKKFQEQQEQLKAFNLKLHSLAAEKKDYRLKYEAKIEELRKVKLMAEKLKSDFDKYKQKKYESGARIAQRIEEESIRTSQEIEELRKLLEEKSEELCRAKQLLSKRYDADNNLTESDNTSPEIKVSKEKRENNLIENDQFSDLAVKTSNAELKSSKRLVLEDF